MEQYFAEDTTMLNDGFCEAALKSLMVNTKKCLENPEDYRNDAGLHFKTGNRSYIQIL